MADNVAQAVNDLKKELKALDDQLIRGQKNAQDMFNVIIQGANRSAGSVWNMVGQRGGRLSAKDKNTLRIATEFVDKDGKPINAKTVDDLIRNVQTAIDRKGTKKLNILGIDYDRSQFERLKGDLEALQRMHANPVKTFDDMQRILGRMAPASGSTGTRLGNARATEMTKVWKTTEKANAELVRQQKILEAIKNIESRGGKSAMFEGHRRSVEQLNKLYDESKRKVEEYQRTLNSLGRRGQAAAAGFGDGSVTAQRKQEQNFMRLNRLLNERRKLQREIDLRGGQANEMQSRYQRILNNDIERTIKSMRELESKYSGVTRKASEATMEQRMRNTKTATDQLNRSLKQTNANLSNMIPTVSRLATAFGLAFSVRGIVDFGKKVVETSAQFEMQFVSLKHIIGDADAATKLWSQTLQQALKSPMKAMDLLKYTKQLAAYRIETDKLFETTKRLADVSSGLGVDMQRLILAYGQVKAANYLRASEIRQFTEAGVNVLGELAEYFNDVKGMAVNTADVMQMVTKRMVKFEDVEAIFKRMTDEGGQFYDMQRIQSETVYGQIQKLHDAYDQMLYKIGQGNSGVIHDLIDALQWMVKHWKEVATFIQMNIAALATWRIGVNLARIGWQNFGNTLTTVAVKLKNGKVAFQEITLAEQRARIEAARTAGAISNVSARFKTLGLSIKAAGAALKSFWPMLVISAVVEGVTLLVNSLIHANEELEEFKDELDSLRLDQVESLKKEEKAFDELKKKIDNLTEGTNARKEAIDEMNSKYGQYLNNLVTEKMSMEELAKSYEGAEEKMRALHQEKLREQVENKRIEKLQGIYEEVISDAGGEKLYYHNKENKTGSFTISREAVRYVIDKIYKKIIEDYEKQGIVYETRGVDTELQQLILKTAGEYYGFEEGVIERYVGGNLQQWMEDIEEGAERVYNILSAEMPVVEPRSKADEEKYKKAIKIYKDSKKLLEKDMQSEIDLLTVPEEITDNTERDNYRREQITKIKEKYFKAWQILKNKTEEGIGALVDTEGLGMPSRYDFSNIPKADFEYESKLHVLGMKKLQELNYNVNSEEYKKLVLSLLPTADQLKDGSKDFEQELFRRKKEIKAELKRLAKKINGMWASIYKPIADLLNVELKGINAAIDLRQAVDTEDKSKPAANYKSISNLISLLKEMNSEYNKLSSSAYGYAKSQQKIKSSFSPAFKEIFGFAGIDINQVDTWSKKGLADTMKKVLDTLDEKELWGKFGRDRGKEARDAFVKAWNIAESEVDIELSVRVREDFARQMEEAFSDYGLTLELQDLGISEDVARGLFPDLGYTTLGKLQEIMNKFYTDRQTKDENGNVLFSTEDLNTYRQWAKKVDEEILKSRKEKAKQYSKYLEKEYSERAKLEMKYAMDVAFVRANVTDEEQQKNIIDNLDRKHKNDLNDLNWKSFKESDFYIEMMDDITSLPKEYMQLMLDKIEEILKHPETLSPRALKEAINARQKVLEAQMNIEPLDVMRSSLSMIREAQKDEGVGGGTWKQTKENINQAVTEEAKLIKEYDEKIQRLQDLQGELAGYEKKLENLQKADSDVSLPLLNRILGLDEDGKISSLENLDESRIQGIIDSLTEENEEAKKGYDATAKTDPMNALAVEISNREKLIKTLNDELTARRELENLPLSDKAMAAIATGQTSTGVGAQIQEQQGKKDNSVKKIQNLKQWLKAFTQFDEAFAKFNAAINSTLNSVAGMGNAFYDMFEALGGETDALTDGWKEFGNTMISTITNALTMIPTMVAAFTAAGIAINSALGIIGLIAEALNLLMTAISAISKLSDADNEAEIEKQQKKIDDLKRAYERLDKQIEQTFDTYNYMKDYNKQVQILYQQIEALEKQRAAERAKKNSDDDKIDEYSDAIQDAYDELDELQQKQLEVFGGIGKDNYRSWAEGFVDAWTSAFLETGDGLDALQDHFDEFLQDWFVKQATMRIAGKALAPIMKQIDEAISDTGDIDMNRLYQIKDDMQAALEALNIDLTEFAGMFDLSDSGSLSGLAAGIQGMTEEQANILEAYWNSVRINTANIDQNVSRIADILGAGGVNTNPQLQQLQLIEANTKATYLLLQSASKSGHPQGGLGFKVFMD